jgi:hypothetical protein
MAGKVSFSIIGNVNAITYKEIFPLIRDNSVWIGATHFNTGMYFAVPEGFEYASTYKFERERNGVRVARVPGVCWFANIEHGRRHEPLQLMTTADNIKFSRHKGIQGIGYQVYDNYDAIEVGYVDAIPKDHDGLMGVPITFLARYNPEQFEIFGITKTWDDTSGLKKKIYPTQTQVSKSGFRSQVGKLNDGAAIKITDVPVATYYEVGGEMFVQPYARILIRKKD